MLKNKEDVKPKKRKVMYPKDEFPSDYENSSDVDNLKIEKRKKANKYN